MGSYAIVGAHMPIAAGAAWAAQDARHRPGGRVLLRRRDDQHRGVPRGAEHGGGLEAAGRVRLREQPLHGVHADRAGHRRRAPGGGPRRRLRPGVDRRRTGTTPTRCAPSPNGPSSRRARRGPSLVEAKTYRHGGHSRADPAKYRPADEVEAVARARPDPDVPGAAARGRRRRPTCSTRSRPRRSRRSTARPRRRRPGRRRTRRASRPSSGPTEGRRGGTDLPRGRRPRDRPGDGARRDRPTSSGRTSPPPAASSRRPRACWTGSGPSASATRRSPSRRSSAP